MNVVYQTDDNYAVYTGVSLYSLFENNKSEESLNVYILDGGISESNRQKLCQLAKQYQRAIDFIDTKECDGKLESLGAPKYRGSYATYYKLFLTSLIEVTGRILYIDGDTIINSAIRTLYDYPMQGRPVAMAEDTLAYKHKLTLDFAKDEVYFNAGVILFDTDEMKRGGFDDRMKNHIINERCEYVKHDQDLINVVYRGNITELPLRYNMQSIHAAASLKDYVKVYSDIIKGDINELADERANAVICHFLRFNGQFAWNKKSIHPYADLYHQYKNASPWSECEDVKSPEGMIFVIERLMYRCMPRAWFLRIFRMIHDKGELI